MDIVDEKLNPTGQVFSVLGHIANNPIELLGNRVNLDAEDFVNPFHQVVFNAIKNIAVDSKSTIKEITPLAVDVYLEPFAKYYNVWKNNDGVQYLADAKKSQEQFSFEHDYSLVKKFSTLRKYYREGVDIKDIFDYETSDLNKRNEFNKKIEAMEVSDIVEHYTNKIINIRDEITIDDEAVVKFSADEGIDTLLARLNEEPVMGYPFINGYYNTLFRGMQGGRFMLRSAASGGGKAVALDTLIPMADGTKKFAKDVKVGDNLISRKGEPTQVLAKYPQPKHMLYKVTSYDGREQILHPNHLMSVWSQKQKDYRKYNHECLLTRPLEDIMKDYKSVSKDGDNAHKYLLPLAEPVQYKEQQHVIPPYALGVLLGDGSLGEVNQGKFVASFNEEDVLNNFMKSIGSTEYKHKDYNYNYRFTQENNPVVGDYIKEIKNLGLNHTTVSKYIPDEYLYDSIENRMELLKGLIDTDGYIGFSDGRNGYNISFSTVSRKLKDSFLTLIDGLGIGRRVSMDNRAYEKYSTGEMFTISLFTDKKIWSSSKHEAHTGGHEWISNKHLGMPIMKIEEYKEEESVCFTVDNDEHLFLINDYIVTHNTRSSIRDMANASFTERYETGKGWINTGVAVPTLFISTELNKDELQTILLAYVSGLTTSEIESGDYSKFEKQRLEHAVEVIQKSEMYFVYVEDFSTVDIQMIVEEYVVRHNIKFAVFDYIQNSPKLSKSFQESYGHNLREDEILIELSRSLKNMSEKYNIFIMSSTQLNSMSDDDNIRVSRTGRALRGGSATINKADYGIIVAKPTAADLKKLNPILKEGGFNGDPNYGHFIFKNRSGRSDVILWTQYDMGNMRETPLFITDFNYNLIDDIPNSKVNVSSADKSEDDVVF